MKIVALGDTHGRTAWKEIVATETYDKLVFIGDYFDSYDGVPVTHQLQNFQNIVDYKIQNPAKVILLLGNHDYHYLKTTNEQYTGFQKYHKIDIQEALQPALDAQLLQMCFQCDNVLFTHAGITKTWCNNNGILLPTIEQSINQLFIERPGAFKFSRGANNSSKGDDICQSPIWVRPPSLHADRLDNQKQVVGHTSMKNIVINNHIAFIDTLGSSGQYLSVHDGVFMPSPYKKPLL